MSKPNILVLLADQLRADCVGYAGCYPVRTPHLDALAAQGARFTHAFTPTPVCAPARQALLTGRRPDAYGALWNYDFIPTATADPQGYCYTRTLAEAGYTQAFVGKWHSGGTPQDFGFTHVVGAEGHAALLREKYPHVRFDAGWLGEDSPLPVADTKAHWLGARASELIGQLSAAGQPWHLRLDITDPHLPCRPSAPFAGMYRPEDMTPWPGWGDDFVGKPYIQRQQPISWGIDQMTWDDWAPAVARYFAMISQVDDMFGRVLAALDAAGAADNTIVYFTSDHGDMCGSHGMLDKHYVLYDDVMAVPMAVRWPGHIAPGTVVNDYVSQCLDFAPTVESLLGREPPAHLHGYSLLPLLCGQAQQQRPAYAVASGNGQQFGLYTQRALRTDVYKYVWNLTDTDELYDLQADPGELHNRIADPALADTLADLRRDLRAELIRQEDPFARSGWLDGQLLRGTKA